MVLRMLLFFNEFSILSERLVSSLGNLLLNGNLSFHINYPSNSTVSQFLDLLNCFNLDIVNLCTPTHKNNNVLDLIIARSSETSYLSQIYQFKILSFLITSHFPSAWLSRNQLTRNSLP